MPGAEYLERLGTHLRDNKTRYAGAAAVTVPAISAVCYFGPEASQKFVTETANNSAAYLLCQLPKLKTLATSDAAIATYKYVAASLLGILSGGYGYEKFVTKPLRKELAYQKETMIAVDSYLATNGKNVLPQNVTANSIFKAQELVKTQAAVEAQLQNIAAAKSKITCTKAAEEGEE